MENKALFVSELSDAISHSCDRYNRALPLVYEKDQSGEWVYFGKLDEDHRVRVSCSSIPQMMIDIAKGVFGC